MDRLPVEILFEIIDCEWLFLLPETTKYLLSS